MVIIHQLVKFQANPHMHSPANARKPLRTDGRTDGHAVKRLRLVGWTNGPMYRSKKGISGFRRTDGWTDGQPENIMHPAPKGGGIKIGCVPWRNCWGYNHCILPCSRISPTHLKIRHLQIKSTGARSTNELQWLNLKRGIQDSNPHNSF